MIEQLSSDNGLRRVEGTSPTIIEASPVSDSRLEASLEALELKNRLKIRSDICRFLIKALGFSTACCFLLIFLQGFRAWGFQMDGGFLRWLTGATVVQLVAFLGIFTREVWQKTTNNPRKPPKISKKKLSG
jgi:hypothetical protein